MGIYGAIGRKICQKTVDRVLLSRHGKYSGNSILNPMHTSAKMHAPCISELICSPSQIVKSPNDRREYRIIQLQNGLRSILISDKISTHQQKLNAKHEEVLPTSAENMLGDLSLRCSAPDATADTDNESDCISRVKSQPVLSSYAASHPQRKRTCSASEEILEEHDKSAGTSGPCSPGLKPPTRKRSTQHSKLAAAALCVGAGSFSDPREAEGLAHFLEHVLFMGNEKYPEENGFDVFVKMHGGSNNASTDAERTVFEFDINPQHLKEGLDRLASCFVSPLLSHTSIENELKAVDSEFVQGVQVDSARRLQLLSSIARCDHPFSKFLWGNSISLKEEPEKNGVDMQALLRKFWTEFYHASNMTLAVSSSDSLDSLQSMVEECFSVIPSRSRNGADFSSSKEPFDLDIFHKIYYVVPVKDIHHLEITWVLPSLMKHYRVKAIDYLSWLVGHEGKGSIQALLKERGLVLSILAGNGEAGVEHNSSYSFFTCSATLTDEGIKNVFEVITVIFQYLKMLQERGPVREIYEEIQAIEAMKFNFEEQDEAIEVVQSLCENLQLYCPEDVLAGQMLLRDFNVEILEQVQKAITPENANIMVMWKNYETMCTEEEKWFKTAYIAKDVPDEWRDKWKDLKTNSSLHLPSQNLFIAKEFQLVPADREATLFPVLIHESNLGKLWYKHDTIFQLPKVRLYFHLISPVPYSSIKNAVCADIFLSIFNHELKEISYDASVAELSYDIGVGEKGMTLCFDGFNDKLKLLVDIVLGKLCHFDFSSSTFDIIKKVAMRSYKNYLLKPAKLVRTLRLSVLQKFHWTSAEKRRVCMNLTEDDVRVFAKELISDIKIHGLVQGNISAADALKYQTDMYRIFSYKPLSEENFPTVIVNQLPVGSSIIRHAGFNPDDANTVMTNYYQVGPGGIYEFTLTQLLVHMMEEPCFDILRTKEQLGYTVYASCRSTFGIIGMSVTVESQANKFTASYIDSRIEAFLGSFHGKLMDQSEETFQKQVSALVLLKQHVDLSLADEADRNFSEIYNETYLFSRLQKEVSTLKKITKEELVHWYEQFESSSLRYRKLSVQVVGNTSVAPDSIDEHSDTDASSDEESSSDSEDETDAGNEGAVTVTPTQVSDSQYGHYINDIDTFKRTLEEYPVSKIM